MTSPALALRRCRIWSLDLRTEDVRTVLHEHAHFHKFERYDAICELLDGSVVTVYARQVQFIDRRGATPAPTLAPQELRRLALAAGARFRGQADSSFIFSMEALDIYTRGVIAGSQP